MRYLIFFGSFLIVFVFSSSLSWARVVSGDQQSATAGMADNPAAYENDNPPYFDDCDVTTDPTKIRHCAQRDALVHLDRFLANSTCAPYITEMIYEPFWPAGQIQIGGLIPASFDEAWDQEMCSERWWGWWDALQTIEELDLEELNDSQLSRAASPIQMAHCRLDEAGELVESSSGQKMKDFPSIQIDSEELFYLNVQNRSRVRGMSRFSVAVKKTLSGNEEMLGGVRNLEITDQLLLQADRMRSGEATVRLRYIPDSYLGEYDRIQPYLNGELNALIIRELQYYSARYDRDQIAATKQSIMSAYTGTSNSFELYHNLLIERMILSGKMSILELPAEAMLAITPARLAGWVNVLDLTRPIYRNGSGGVDSPANSPEQNALDVPLQAVLSFLQNYSRQESLGSIQLYPHEVFLNQMGDDGPKALEVIVRLKSDRSIAADLLGSISIWAVRDFIQPEAAVAGRTSYDQLIRQVVPSYVLNQRTTQVSAEWAQALAEMQMRKNFIKTSEQIYHPTGSALEVEEGPYVYARLGDVNNLSEEHKILALGIPRVRSGQSITTSEVYYTNELYRLHELLSMSELTRRELHGLHLPSLKKMPRHLISGLGGDRIRGHIRDSWALPCYKRSFERHYGIELVDPIAEMSNDEFIEYRDSIRSLRDLAQSENFRHCLNVQETIISEAYTNQNDEFLQKFDQKQFTQDEIDEGKDYDRRLFLILTALLSEPWYSIEKWQNSLYSPDVLHQIVSDELYEGRFDLQINAISALFENLDTDELRKISVLAVLQIDDDFLQSSHASFVRILPSDVTLEVFDENPNASIDFCARVNFTGHDPLVVSETEAQKNAQANSNSSSAGGLLDHAAFSLIDPSGNLIGSSFNSFAGLIATSDTTSSNLGAETSRGIGLPSSGNSGGGGCMLNVKSHSHGQGLLIVLLMGIIISLARRKTKRIS